MKLFSTYYFAYLKYLLSGKNSDILIRLYREKGVSIGINCAIYSPIITPESYLISIGDNVTIAPGVKLLTHDNSVCKIFPEFTDVFGRINIGSNCFIGANVIVLPGVTLGDTCIVAAGSVVTKSFPRGVIIAGNPAKQISTIEDYQAKVKHYCFSTEGMDAEQKKKALLENVRMVVR